MLRESKKHLDMRERMLFHVILDLHNVQKSVTRILYLGKLPVIQTHYTKQEPPWPIYQSKDQFGTKVSDHTATALQAWHQTGSEPEAKQSLRKVRVQQCSRPCPG